MSTIKELEKLFVKGVISRREFLARVAALGIATAVSPTLFSIPARAETPKRGGRLRMGVAGGNTTDSLDPINIPDTMPTNINWSLRNNLVEVDAESNAVPELAESWEASKDAATWRFNLRKGVEFHNGKTLEAQDVIDSINHHRGEDSKSPAKGIVDPIKKLEADGPNVVVFHLDGGNADFPYILSDYHLTIQPAGTEGAEYEKGIGTGPFVLVKYEPGVNAFVKRNPNYWKEGLPYFDEVETIGISDVNSRTNALKTGQIDAMNRPDPRTMHLLAKSPNLEVLKIPSGKHFTFPMRADTKPFDNNDVRLALKYAIDREQIVNTVLKGAGRVANDHPIPTTYRFYNPNLPQRKYDPDKAKFHLKKAGLEGHTFQLHTSNGCYDGAVDAAILYSESAAKAGVKIKVVREPSDGYWANVWMQVPWSVSYWNGRTVEDLVLSIAYAADAKWNEAFWKHDRFNKLLRDARAELDEAKRREMYYECQKILRDECSSIIYMFGDQLIAANKKLGHPEKVAGNWEMDGARMAERWWFKS